MAASCDLLDVDPPELEFPFVLDKQISCPLRLSNRTDRTVAFKVVHLLICGVDPREFLCGIAGGLMRISLFSYAFLGALVICVGSTSRRRAPGSTACVPTMAWCTVVVTMQAQKVVPPDLQCKDKFLVQSAVVSDGLLAKDITSQMFVKDRGNVVEEVKLKVAHVMPPEPQSEIAEEHDGLERILMPMQKIVDNERSTSGLSSGSASLRSAEEVGSPVGRIVKNEEFLKAARPALETKTYAGPAEQSHQLSAIIAKLTEEKNSALEQNRKLQDELELVRREASKQQGSFSLVLLIALGVLCVILGYLVKK